MCYCFTYDAASQSIDLDIDENAVTTKSFDSNNNYPSKLRLQIIKLSKNDKITLNDSDTKAMTNSNENRNLKNIIKLINLNDKWEKMSKFDIIFQTFDLLSDDFIVGFYFRTQTEMNIKLNVSQP